MKLEPKEIYHIYNRGINRLPIFFERENYCYFLKKVKIFLSPNCEILAYALMPNHFHFLVVGNERSNLPYRKSNRRKGSLPRKKSLINLTLFSWGLQQLLSSYSRGFNRRYHRTGSLFQQNTKSKQTSNESIIDDYSLLCFMYIHNNPVRSGLVNSPEEYEFSSYNDYIENKEDSICNLSLARELLSLDQNDIFQFNTIEIPNEILTKIFK